MTHLQAGSDLKTSKAEIAFKGLYFDFHVVIVPDARCELIVVEVWFVT